MIFGRENPVYESGIDMLFLRWFVGSHLSGCPSCFPRLGANGLQPLHGVAIEQNFAAFLALLTLQTRNYKRFAPHFRLVV